MDGMDGNGLKLEKIGLKKFIMVNIALSDKFHLITNQIFATCIQQIYFSFYNHLLRKRDLSSESRNPISEDLKHHLN